MHGYGGGYYKGPLGGSQLQTYSQASAGYNQGRGAMAQGYVGYEMGYQQKPPDYQTGGYQTSQGGYYPPPPYDGGYQQHPTIP